MAAFHAMWSIGGAFAALIGAAALKADVPTAVSLSGAGVLCIVISLVASRFLIEAPAEPDRRTRRPARVAPPAKLVWQLGGLAFALMLAEGVANDWAALQFRDVLETSTSTAAYAYGAFASR